MINKLTLCAVAVCSALSGTAAWAADSDYQLEQVLMLSRHNLRAPLADNGSLLAQATRKSWPKWEVPGGQLTTKGGVLEVYMGRYTREWLAQQGLVKAGECPAPDAVYAYANSLQRTVATAQFFVAGAFPGCDVSVSHQDEMGAMDPIFSPVITDGSDAFHQQALAAMNAEGEKLGLKPAFQRLEKIIDYKNSPACEGKKQCDLSRDGQNSFSADKGKEPNVAGPLKVGNSLVDAFTLQYYEGLPLEQVAWGQIKTAEQWQELAAIKNGYQNTLFTSPQVARNVAAPLTDYIRSLLTEQDKNATPAVTLMVGHDSNIASLLAAMDFKPYELSGQNELTPIGGMVQFQRWHDKKNDRELVKVEYVYQTSEQLRDAASLSLDNPPKRVTLQMAGCPTDANGFCPWDTFTKVLTDALQGTPQQVAAAADAGVTPAAEKVTADNAAAVKAPADKASADNASAGKAAEKSGAEKASAEKAAQLTAQADRAAADKAAAEQAARDKAAQAAKAKAAADKAAAEKAAGDKAASDKAAAAKDADKPAAKEAQPQAESKAAQPAG